jgi:hypothetical protein
MKARVNPSGAQVGRPKQASLVLSCFAALGQQGDWGAPRTQVSLVWAPGTAHVSPEIADDNGQSHRGSGSCPVCHYYFLPRLSLVCNLSQVSQDTGWPSHLLLRLLPTRNPLMGFSRIQGSGVEGGLSLGLSTQKGLSGAKQKKVLRTQ